MLNEELNGREEHEGEEETIKEKRIRVLQSVPIPSRSWTSTQVLPSPQRAPLCFPQSIPIQNSRRQILPQKP